MATTVNGWEVLDQRTDGPLPRLRQWTVPGANRTLYLRDGAVGFLLVHMMLWFHEKVERLNLPGQVWDEWGWAVRPVRGQESGYSNHAGGAAADVNATLHPLGVAVSRTFTPRQVASVKRRLRLYRGALIWGGVWSRPDGMHFEATGGLDKCERVARLLLMTPRGRRILKANPGAEKVIRS